MPVDCTLELVAGLEICGYEENSEEQVDASEPKIAGSEAMLKIEHDESRSSAELLDHRWNHHWPQADRIARDHQECNLKGQTDADKTVVEAGMRDRRRVLTADQVKHEIQRRENQHAPNAGDQESDLCEFHFILAPPAALRHCRGTRAEERYQASRSRSDTSDNRTGRLHKNARRASPECGT